MFCCICKHENTGTWEDRMMYRLPTIEHKHADLGRVKEWNVYCEECLQDYLKEFVIEEDE